MGKLDPALRAKRILASTISAFKNWKRTTLTIAVSAFFYSLFAFNTNISWNSEILRTGAWLQILEYGTASILTSGITSLLITVIYSALAAVTVVITLLSLRSNGLSISGLGGSLPGFLVAGCSCGVGLAGLIGIAGLTSTLPFNGDLLKIAGILVMLYALEELGKPEKCDVEISYES